MATKRKIQEIDIPSLKAMQQRGEDFDLIDVREPDEVQRGTIPGAKHISRGILERDIDNTTTDKNCKLVLYCGRANRSALSAGCSRRWDQERVVAEGRLVGVEVSVADTRKESS